MTGPWLSNILLYSVQIGLILSCGAGALSMLRLRLPACRLLCWQSLLLACLALPFLEPWQPGSAGISISMSAPVFHGMSGTPAARPTLPWREGLATCIALGILFRLAVFGLGLARLREYRRRALPEPAAARAIRTLLGVRATVKVSGDIPGPATFGFLRPVVLLPSRWAENEAVLYHELIHVRRRDWLWMACEELARALLWFHPLIWYAIGQIQLAREQVVDREVVTLTQSREQYLETLLAIAAARSGLDLAPAPLFLRRRHLKQRVAALSKEVSMSKLRLRSSLACFFALTASVAWFADRAFPLQAAAQEQAQDSPTKAKHPSVIYKAPVIYPPDAKANKVEGKVWMKIQIDQSGSIADAYVTSGPEPLRQAALDSVRQWRFAPGPELPAQAEISVNFRLDDRAAAAPAQDGNSPQPMRVGGNQQSLKLIHKVPPIYPPEAKAARIQGLVRLQILVDAEGAVKDLEVVEGDPLLAEAAVSAVRQWTYRPTLLNGLPVEVSSMVDVNFTLLH